MSIGKNIKRIRENYDISQQELAKRTDITSSMMSYIEKGEKIPSVAVLKRISEVLHCTMDELVADIKQ